ncbi:MAG: DUF6457 domain-containing protein [Propionibacteriaceae bacterium]|nr:DUF6457 domain-containing protein [Propionibacteriaceae bacterium]
MKRPPIDPAPWQPWIDHVCAAVDVDPLLVDVRAIHALTGDVAAAFTRPMAPVSAHLWGLARGTDGEADPQRLREALVDVAGRQD